jgi:DNA-directed RNA polymerase specialized sigma24 family protein
VSWRPWLAGATPREVLSRIVQDDPLHVRERVATALREGAYLLDADQVQLRSLALVARHAARYRGRPEFGAWLDGLVAEAVQSILREEAERECSLDVANEDRGRGADACRERSAAHETLVPAVFLALAKPLGLEPAAMGRACAAFNRLPTTDRTAFFALVLDSRSLDELARESGESATEIARHARRGLDAILSVSNSDGDALSNLSGKDADDGSSGKLTEGGAVS